MAGKGKRNMHSAHKSWAEMHLSGLPPEDMEVACLVLGALAVPIASEAVRAVAISALARRFAERIAT